MKKIVFPLLIVLLFIGGEFAQTEQTLTLKPGFNFVSFTSSISMTPAQLKTQNPAVEDVYLFSAAGDTALNVSGDALQTIGNISIKIGFNLIGFSKIIIKATSLINP